MVAFQGRRVAGSPLVDGLERPSYCIPLKCYKSSRPCTALAVTSQGRYSMRFRQSRQPPAYFGRRFQYRVLGMLLLLSLVIVAIQVAADPKTWYWLTGPPAVEPADESRPPVSLDDIDFSVQLDGQQRSRLRDDEFLSGLSPDADDPNASSPANAKPPRDSTPNRPSDDNRDGEEDGGPSPSVAPQNQTRGQSAEEFQEVDLDAAVDKSLLSRVRDNKLGIWPDERDAYYALLAKARAVPAAVQNAAARDDTAFAVLMVESDRFRGELVTITGQVKRLWTLPAAPNDHGIDDVYEAWLLTPDSGNNPWVIRFTSLPDGFPEGDALDERVRVTGYFFKRFGYASHQGLHTAPMLLAKRMQWIRPRTTRRQEDSGLMPYVLGFVALLGTSLAGMLWYFTLGDRRFHRNYLKRVNPNPRDVLSTLDDVQTTDVRDLFRTMTENAAADAGGDDDLTDDGNTDDRP
jgi:hypothetical protein